MNTNEIISALEVLAQKLNVPLNHLWQIAIRQQYIDIVEDLLGIILCGVGIYFAIKYLLKEFKGECYIDDFVVILLSILLVILVPIIIIISVDMINHISNPEWQALIDISKLFFPPLIR